MKPLSKRASGNIVKTCGCGKSFTQEEWNKLKYKYIQDIREFVLPEDRNDPNTLLEFRDCDNKHVIREGRDEPCNSTLGIPVSEKHAKEMIKQHGK